MSTVQTQLYGCLQLFETVTNILSLLFEDTTLYVKINGRDFLSIPYYADKNAYKEEDQVVSTDGFFCRGGWIKDLKYVPGYRNNESE